MKFFVCTIQVFHYLGLLMKTNGQQFTDNLQMSTKNGKSENKTLKKVAIWKISWKKKVCATKKLSKVLTYFGKH